jgi:hypothetical protein
MAISVDNYQYTVFTADSWTKPNTPNNILSLNYYIDKPEDVEIYAYYEDTSRVLLQYHNYYEVLPYFNDPTQQFKNYQAYEYGYKVARTDLDYPKGGLTGVEDPIYIVITRVQDTALNLDFSTDFIDAQSMKLLFTKINTLLQEFKEKIKYNLHFPEDWNNIGFNWNPNDPDSKFEFDLSVIGNFFGTNIRNVPISVNIDPDTQKLSIGTYPKDKSEALDGILEMVKQIELNKKNISDLQSFTQSLQQQINTEVQTRTTEDIRVLTEAKAYTDEKLGNSEAELKEYIDTHDNLEIEARIQGDEDTLKSANSYTNNLVQEIIDEGGKFIGVSFQTHADLIAWEAQGIPTTIQPADFTYVLEDEDHDGHTTRYICELDDQGNKVFDFAYVININFNNDQWAAINSGMTLEQRLQIILEIDQLKQFDITINDRVNHLENHTATKEELEAVKEDLDNRKEDRHNERKLNLEDTDELLINDREKVNWKSLREKMVLGGTTKKPDDSTWANTTTFNLDYWELIFDNFSSTNSGVSAQLPIKAGKWYGIFLSGGNGGETQNTVSGSGAAGRDIFYSSMDDTLLIGIGGRGIDMTVPSNSAGGASAGGGTWIYSDRQKIAFCAGGGGGGVERRATWSEFLKGAAGGGFGMGGAGYCNVGAAGGNYTKTAGGGCGDYSWQLDNPNVGSSGNIDGSHTLFHLSRSARDIVQIGASGFTRFGADPIIMEPGSGAKIFNGKNGKTNCRIQAINTTLSGRVVIYEYIGTDLNDSSLVTYEDIKNKADKIAKDNTFEITADFTVLDTFTEADQSYTEYHPAGNYNTTLDFKNFLTTTDPERVADGQNTYEVNFNDQYKLNIQENLSENIINLISNPRPNHTVGIFNSIDNDSKLPEGYNQKAKVIFYNNGTQIGVDDRYNLPKLNQNSLVPIYTPNSNFVCSIYLPGISANDCIIIKDVKQDNYYVYWTDTKKFKHIEDVQSYDFGNIYYLKNRLGVLVGDSADQSICGIFEPRDGYNIAPVLIELDQELWSCKATVLKEDETGVFIFFNTKGLYRLNPTNTLDLLYSYVSDCNAQFLDNKIYISSINGDLDIIYQDGSREQLDTIDYINDKLQYDYTIEGPEETGLVHWFHTPNEDKSRTDGFIFKIDSFNQFTVLPYIAFGGVKTSLDEGYWLCRTNENLTDGYLRIIKTDGTIEEVFNDQFIGYTFNHIVKNRDADYFHTTKYDEGFNTTLLTIFKNYKIEDKYYDFVSENNTSTELLIDFFQWDDGSFCLVTQSSYGNPQNSVASVYFYKDGIREYEYYEHYNPFVYDVSIFEKPGEYLLLFKTDSGADIFSNVFIMNALTHENIRNFINHPANKKQVFYTYQGHNWYHYDNYENYIYDLTWVDREETDIPYGKYKSNAHIKIKNRGNIVWDSANEPGYLSFVEERLVIERNEATGLDVLINYRSNIFLDDMAEESITFIPIEQLHQDFKYSIIGEDSENRNSPIQYISLGSKIVKVNLQNYQDSSDLILQTWDAPNGVVFGKLFWWADDLWCCTSGSGIYNVLMGYSRGIGFDWIDAAVVENTPDLEKYCVAVGTMGYCLMDPDGSSVMNINGKSFGHLVRIRDRPNILMVGGYGLGWILVAQGSIQLSEKVPFSNNLWYDNIKLGEYYRDSSVYFVMYALRHPKNWQILTDEPLQLIRCTNYSSDSVESYTIPCSNGAYYNYPTGHVSIVEGVKNPVWNDWNITTRQTKFVYPIMIGSRENNSTQCLLYMFNSTNKTITELNCNTGEEISVNNGEIVYYDNFSDSDEYWRMYFVRSNTISRVDVFKTTTRIDVYNKSQSFGFLNHAFSTSTANTAIPNSYTGFAIVSNSIEVVKDAKTYLSYNAPLYSDTNLRYYADHIYSGNLSILNLSYSVEDTNNPSNSKYYTYDETKPAWIGVNLIYDKFQRATDYTQGATLDWKTNLWSVPFGGSPNEVNFFMPFDETINYGYEYKIGVKLYQGQEQKFSFFKSGNTLQITGDLTPEYTYTFTVNNPDPISPQPEDMWVKFECLAFGGKSDYNNGKSYYLIEEDYHVETQIKYANLFHVDKQLKLMEYMKNTNLFSDYEKGQQFIDIHDGDVKHYVVVEDYTPSGSIQQDFDDGHILELEDEKGTWGLIEGDIVNQHDLQNEFSDKLQEAKDFTAAEMSIMTDYVNRQIENVETNDKAYTDEKILEEQESRERADGFLDHKIDERVIEINEKITELASELDRDFKELEEEIQEDVESKVDKSFAEETVTYVIGDFVMTPDLENKKLYTVKTALSVDGKPTMHYDTNIQLGSHMTLDIDPDDANGLILNSIGGGGVSDWGDIEGDITNQTDLQEEFVTQFQKAKDYTDVAQHEVEEEIENLSDTLNQTIDTKVGEVAADLVTTKSELEDELTTTKSELEGELATEKSDRETGDTNIENNLNAEAGLRQSADDLLGSRIDTETSNRIQGDTDTLGSSKTYTDNAIAGAQLATQTWLPAVYSVAELPDKTGEEKNFLCRVINDPDSSKNGVYQWVDDNDEWKWDYFSDNADFIDENELNTAIAAEAQLRTNADNILRTSIESEESARSSADTTLQGNINTEAVNRENADEELQTNINQEILDRGEAVQNIKGLLNQEISDRSEEDGVLNDAITNEGNARQEADTTLQTNIEQVDQDRQADFSTLIRKINELTANEIEWEFQSGVTLYDKVNEKQDELVSGTNIKTINGTNILGSGNATIPVTYTSLKQPPVVKFYGSSSTTSPGQWTLYVYDAPIPVGATINIGGYYDEYTAVSSATSSAPTLGAGSIASSLTLTDSYGTARTGNNASFSVTLTVKTEIPAGTYTDCIRTVASHTAHFIPATVRLPATWYQPQNVSTSAIIPQSALITNLNSNFTVNVWNVRKCFNGEFIWFYIDFKFPNTFTKAQGNSTIADLILRPNVDLGLVGDLRFGPSGSSFNANLQQTGSFSWRNMSANSISITNAMDFTITGMIHSSSWTSLANYQI